MKQLFAGLILLMAGNCGWSQVNVQPRFTITNSDRSFFKKNPLFLEKLRHLSLDSMRFSHFAPAGSVYTLHRNGMPCLVPDTALAYNMPVKKISGNSNMPNGYRPNNGLIIWNKKY